MKKIKFKNPLIFCILWLYASFACAGSWYIGAGAGNSSFHYYEDFIADNQSDLDDINQIAGVNASASSDDSDTAIKLFGGYDFNKYFSVEAGYTDLGESSYSFSLTDSTGPVTDRIYLNSTYGISGFHSAAIGKIPLSELVSLTARLGIYVWKVDTDESIRIEGTVSSQASDSSSDDGTDLFYGIGLNVSWFSVYYETYNIDANIGGNSQELDADLIGISGSFTF